MRGYGQFCPIAIASEVFAERWTPLVVRELFCGSRRFNDLLRGLPRMPRSVLVQRLKTLEKAGVIERRANNGGRIEYLLTPAGRELGEIVLSLGDWGKRWADVEVSAKNVDPELLMWDMHRRLVGDRLPETRTVVQFDLTGVRTGSYWLVLERPSASVCFTDPGFEPDLVVTADTIAMHRVWVGQLPLAHALRDGSIILDGPVQLRRAFPGWLALSIFVDR